MHDRTRLVVIAQSIVIVLLLFLYLTKPGGEESAPAPGLASEEEAPTGERPHRAKGAIGTTLDTGGVASAPEVRSERSSAAVKMSPVLYGRTVDGSGEAVPGVWITLESEASGRRLSGRSAEDGAFAFACMEAGTWTVQTRKSGHVPGYERLPLRDAAAPRYLELRIPEALRVEVEIVGSSGKAADHLLSALPHHVRYGFSVFATQEPSGASLPVASGADIQNFGLADWWPRWLRGAHSDELDALPRSVEGLLDLHTEPPVWLHLALRGHVLHSQLLPPGTSRLRFTLAEGRLSQQLAGLRVRILDENGRPRGEEVTARVEGPLGHWSREMQPDETGRVDFGALPPGRATFRVLGKGTELFLRELNLPLGGTTELGDLRISSSVTLAGRILSESGAPCVGQIAFYPLADKDELFLQRLRRSSGSGPDGSFQAGALGRRRYRFVAWQGKELGARGVVDLSSGAQEGFVVELERRHLVRFAWSAPANPRTWLHYKIVDAEGLPVGSGQVGSRKLAREWLEAGDYTLILHDGRQEKSRQRFRVDGGPQTIRVNVP